MTERSKADLEQIAMDAIRDFVNRPEADGIHRALLDAYDEQAVEIARLRELVRCLTDDDPCWFDHNGGCQAHGYLSLRQGEKCPQFEAQAVTAALDEADRAGSKPTS